MKFIKLLTLTVFMAVLSTPSIGYGYQDDYTYVYGEYNIGSIDFGAGKESIDGATFGISFSVVDSWYFKLDNQSYVAEDEVAVGGGIVLGTNFEVDFLTANLGYHFEWLENTDLIFELGYADIEDNIDVDNGYNVVFGFRNTTYKNFELGANVQYSNVFDGSSILNLEGRYEFAPLFSLGLKLGIDDEGGQLGGLDIRYSF